MNTFENPEFTSLPADIIDDFNGCFQDNVSDIQDCVGKLETSASAEQIHQLFRHMHSLKGNCKMVNLDQASDVVHALEDIVTDIRAGQYGYITEVGDLIMAGIAQIEQLIATLRQQGCASADHVAWLLQLINGIRHCADDQRSALLHSALVELGAGEPAGVPSIDAVEEVVVTAEPSAAVSGSDGDADLQFFHSLAVKIDQLSIFWKNRTQETIPLARALNALLGEVADPQQLEAAVCVHDMGMAMIPHTLFNKQAEFTRAEQRIVEGHVDVGADMLERIDGWRAAAEYVRQHHERFDGCGYPQRLKGAAISPGARILAIVDTFFAVTNERPDRSYRRSILSAMSEINGNVGTQFDPEYVDAFNQVVREQFIGKRG